MIKVLLLSIMIVGCSQVMPEVPPTVDNQIEALKAANLEVEQVSPLEDLPPGATEGSKFYTPSHCDGCSSVILIFENEGQLLTTKAMMIEAGKTNDALKFHVYHSGRVLLRMGGIMDQRKAHRYASALGMD